MRAPAWSLAVARCLACALGLAASPARAIMPEGSSAVILAIETGEVVGAARACGLRRAEAAAVVRALRPRIRALALGADERSRARLRYGKAVRRAAATMRNTGRDACPAALLAARALPRR